MSKTPVSDNSLLTERFRSRIFVEGADDSHMCYHLLTIHHIPILDKDQQDGDRSTVEGKIEIVVKGGFEKVLAAVEIELESEDLKDLSIVIDADENCQAHWNALRAILIRAGYQNVPLQPLLSGTVLRQEGKPTVGIWIMPNNQLPGALEEFFRFLVPADDQLWEVAEDSVQRAIAIERRFIQEYEMKAKIHAWLAFQKEPGKPLGQAITKRFFDPRAPHAQLFVQWIRDVFQIHP